jgi:hypothetical protein
VLKTALSRRIKNGEYNVDASEDRLDGLQDGGRGDGVGAAGAAPFTEEVCEEEEADFAGVPGTYSHARATARERGDFDPGVDPEEDRDDDRECGGD